jgi:hypothetical protein
MIEGPLLETLTHRLAECPPDFLAEPRFGRAGAIHVDAVVSDLLVSLAGAALTPKQAEAFRQADAKKHRNLYALVLIACWLLYDDWFREKKNLGEAENLAEAARQFLSTGLTELAEVVKAPQCISDPDRREELSRLCLHRLGRYPAGETEAQAYDRLTTLNTTERQRVIAATRAAEKRAQEVREAMAKKAAEEAADKWSRE